MIRCENGNGQRSSESSISMTGCHFEAALSNFSYLRDTYIPILTSYRINEWHHIQKIICAWFHLIHSEELAKSKIYLNWKFSLVVKTLRNCSMKKYICESTVQTLRPQVILLASALSNNQLYMKGGMKSVTMMGGLCCFHTSLSLDSLMLCSVNATCNSMVRALGNCTMGSLQCGFILELNWIQLCAK